LIAAIHFSKEQFSAAPNRINNHLEAAERE